MEALKQQQRSVVITDPEKHDAMKMLRLMGMPVLLAPGEAEAQCAALCKAGLAYGVVSEDMDTLTHGAPYLIRHFNKRGTPNVIFRKHTIDLPPGFSARRQVVDVAVHRLFDSLRLRLHNANQQCRANEGLQTLARPSGHIPDHRLD